MDSLKQRRKSDSPEEQDPGLLDGILANLDLPPIPPSGVVAARKDRSVLDSQDDNSRLEAELNASQLEIAKLKSQLAEERNKSIDANPKEPSASGFAHSSPKPSDEESDNEAEKGSDGDQSSEEEESLHSSSGDEAEGDQEGSDKEKGPSESDSDDLEILEDNSQNSYFRKLLNAPDPTLGRNSSSTDSQQGSRDPRLSQAQISQVQPPREPVPPLEETASVPSQVSSKSEIPEDLKDLVSLTPTSEYFSPSERDWRVAEDSLAFLSIEDDGRRMWNFTRGPDNCGLKVSSELVLEKLVSGKTLLALTERAGKWDQLSLAFSHLGKPEHDSLFDAEKRKLRRKQIMIFLRTKDNSCAEALGGWEASEDGIKVLVDKLPIPLKTLAERKRPARATSPPLAFNFTGKVDSEAQNFLDAVYGDGKQIKESLEWGKYLNQDRLADPGSTKVLDTLQKDLAQVVRPLQCSLAVADLADHIGGANLKDTLSKEGLKELAQVMGVLSAESAQALLPLADHRAALFEAEKKRMREVSIRGICPPSIQIELRKTPIFSGGLFPKKDLLEIEGRVQETNHTNFFPALKPVFKRPMSATVKGTPASQYKRARLDSPNPPTKPKFNTKSAHVPKSKGSKAGKKKKTHPANPFQKQFGKSSSAGPKASAGAGKSQDSVSKPKSA